MRRRTWVSLTVVVAILIALGVTVYLRKNAPPEVACLLPEADAIVYFNLKPLRALTHFDKQPIAHDPDYQAFIDATGIEFERDLNQAAFAIQRMANPNGPNGAVAYSEIFEGRFDGPRLTKYLAAHAAGVDHYAGHDIYSIPHQGRTVRVTILGYDLVAVSNTPTPEAIDSMIDRYHSAASPFSGDALLAHYYPQVPLLSQAWAIGRIGLPFASGTPFQFFGLPIPLPADSTFIASIRYVRAIHLRLVQIAPSPAAAKKSVQVAGLAVKILRSAHISGGPDEAAAQELKAMLGTVTVRQKGNRAILNATIPVPLVRSLLSDKDSGISPTPGSATPQENQ